MTVLNILKYSSVCFILLINFSFSQDVQKQKLQLAQSFENDGNIDNAQNLYLELYKINPEKKDYFDGYVRTTLNKQEYSKLLQFVIEHSKLYPSEELSILLGELHWRTGQTKEADSEWDAILNSTQNYNTYLDLSFSQTKLRLFDKAIKTLLNGRKKLKQESIFSDELCSLYSVIGEYKNGIEEIIKSFLANTNRQNGEVQDRKQQIAEGRIAALLNYPEAKTFIYDKLKTASDSKNPKLKRLYAWLLRTINKLPEALDLYKELDDIYNANGGEVYDFSYSCQNDGHYDIAIEGYKWILGKGKESQFSIASLFNLARALELKQNSMEELNAETAKEVINNYRKVIDDYPETATADDCKFNIAQIYFRTGNSDKAINELQGLLKKFYNPATGAKANLLLADIFFIKNDVDKAVNEYGNIIKLYKRFSKEYMRAKYSLAEIEYFRGQVDSAIAHFTDLTVETTSDVSNDALEKINLIEANRNNNKGLNLFAQAEMKEKQLDYTQSKSLYIESSEALPVGELYDNALIRAADIDIKNKSYESAKILLQKIQTADSTTIYADLIEFKLAGILINEKNLSGAIEKLTGLIRKYPKSIYSEESRELIVKLRTQIN